MTIWQNSSEWNRWRGEFCSWALFLRDSKHFSCHGALVCRASGFCCGDDFQKQLFCLDSEDISSAIQYSWERQCPSSQYFFLWGYLKNKVYEKKPRTTVDLKQNIRKKSGSIFSQHAATSDAELPETLGGKCWQQGTPPHRHYIQEVNVVINPLNAELNPFCHLLALLGAHHILHVSRIRVKTL